MIIVTQAQSAFYSKANMYKYSLWLLHSRTIHGIPYIVGLPKSGRLHSFDMELIKNKIEIPWAIIATLDDYTLWHRRMGHTHKCVIKYLKDNTEGGPLL